jgi:hypothetical protein
MLRLDHGIYAFCALSHDPRPTMWAPFTIDGRVWATNGHIIVTMDSVDGEFVELPVCTSPSRKSIAKIMESAVGEYVPVSSIDLPAEEPCRACNGDGLDHDDGTDRGCWYCNGYGVKEYVEAYVGGICFDARYLRLIGSLPGAEIAVGPDYGTPALFRFDGGKGALMPMRPQEPQQ